MKNAPNSKANLDKAIDRFAGNPLRANEVRNLMANAIVAQLIGNGVVKGGTGLKFRYGEVMSRVTEDLDTAWKTNLDAFLKDLRARLSVGWNGFSGEIRILRQGSPKDVPFEYVMQPCDVKLKYLGKPWYTVQLEIGHNEIGDADEYDEVEVPQVLKELFAFLALPCTGSVPAMRLEYQIAQKLHGASEEGSKRAHDLIDLQLIMNEADVDLGRTCDICQELFRYRKKQEWPPRIVKGEKWEEAYGDQKGNLPVLSSVDEAIIWANDLIARIDAAK